MTTRTIHRLPFVLGVAAWAAAAGAQPWPAKIIRDDWGVPHVYAPKARALFYAQGYAQAQDRLWQMEIMRRLATGTLAEWRGPDSVDSDVTSRTLFGSTPRRAALLASADPESREAILSFTDGVNKWIQKATATGQLPVEYAASNVSPRPWTADDSVAIGLLISFNFAADGFDEDTSLAAYTDMVTRLGPVEGAKVFADTHVADDPDAPTTVPGGESAGSAGAALPTPPSPRNRAMAAAAAAREQLARFGEAMRQHGLTGPHSNAVAVGPALSATGHALLLAGPQTGHTLPQFFNEVGLTGGGYNATGAALPGVPGVIVGAGCNYAWSLTTGYSDTCDLFAEAVNPANPGQYLHNGQWLNFDCRVEIIGVAGQAPVPFAVCESIHGPIVGQSGGFAISLAAPFRGREMEQTRGVLAMNRAKSFTDFAQAVSGLVYNLNVLYADTKKNIAYWHTGLVPVRPAGTNPWFPHDGTGPGEWQGTIPFAQMPRAINPAQGYLASWNNKPRAGWSNTALGFEAPGFGIYGPVQRVRALTDPLDGAGPHSISVQKLRDLNRRAALTTCTPSDRRGSVPVATLLEPLLDAVTPAADPRLPDILDRLSAWDRLQHDANGDGKYDSPGVAVFNTWFDQLGGSFADEVGAALDLYTTANLIARTLHGPQAGVPLLHDYLDGPTPGQWATATLVSALDDLTAAFGSSDPATWLAPIATITFEPLGAGQVPPVPFVNRGTYNQITRFFHGHKLLAENVVAPGQSGNPFSPHFADQLPLYVNWQYKPMRLKLPDLHGHVESVTTLWVP